jgi:hypothetical protein
MRLEPAHCKDRALPNCCYAVSGQYRFWALPLSIRARRETYPIHNTLSAKIIILGAKLLFFYKCHRFS